MLQLTTATKAIENFTLGPVDLEIEPGYVYAIIGPNGSGKTTLYRLMMGMVHPDSGSVTRFDADLDVDSAAQTQRIAYVPEALTGHDEWKVKELLDLYARSYPDFDREAAVRALGMVEMNDRFRALSKGMQRRTMLALALASNADLLLLDEPTDGIDPFARRETLASLTGYLESGERSVVIATHNLEDVRRIADYIVLLNAGKVFGTYTRDEVLDGWQRLWLSAEPPETLPGEVMRDSAGGVTLVTRDRIETEAALRAAGIHIVQVAPVDAVESVELILKRDAVGV